MIVTMMKLMKQNLLAPLNVTHRVKSFSIKEQMISMFQHSKCHGVGKKLDSGFDLRHIFTKIKPNSSKKNVCEHNC